MTFLIFLNIPKNYFFIINSQKKAKKMIMFSIECKDCLNFHNEDNRKIEKDLSYGKQLKCKHFERSLSIDIKKGKFEEFVIGFKCKKCKNEEIYGNKNLSDEKQYTCTKCGSGSIFYSYEISDNNDRNQLKIYITPEEKMNIIFINVLMLLFYL